MAATTLTLSSPNALFPSKAVARSKAPALSLRPSPSHGFSSLSFSRSSSSFSFNPLRVSIEQKGMAMKKKPGRGGAAGAVCYVAVLSPRNLQWVSAASTLVLTLAKGTAIQKSFLVPFFAIQAPTSIISWMKSEYGAWAAFLALLVRLFLHIPGELELPFMALLLVIVAPHQAIGLRGTKEGAIIALLIAIYLAFQHFSRTGLQKAFDQGSVVATVGIFGISIASFLFLI
ncbi:cold-regulated 413 inner membrane protein 2, chloroplastic-like [Punica granatum]|uniref:Uncharacterized protein n=2 Tax=Punica granatum TaxID=22663 RepID=A0A2I0KKT8_PUNGR|nr:cold-regulated 413 inner membrane protein 2, chloroplastic-like [Punica granatum]PKI69105.1 hypothetical protein CRG98_010574 [Punica granatum]